MEELGDLDLNGMITTSSSCGMQDLTFQDLIEVSRAIDALPKVEIPIRLIVSKDLEKDEAIEKLTLPARSLPNDYQLPVHIDKFFPEKTFALEYEGRFVVYVANGTRITISKIAKIAPPRFKPFDLTDYGDRLKAQIEKAE